MATLSSQLTGVVSSHLITTVAVVGPAFEHECSDQNLLDSDVAWPRQKLSASEIFRWILPTIFFVVIFAPAIPSPHPGAEPAKVPAFPGTMMPSTPALVQAWIEAHSGLEAHIAPAVFVAF
jgi:hypothetical protein